MRQDITFDSQGVACAAWLYLPPGEGRVPAIAMAHGFSGVKDMDLPHFAERFAAAGFAVILFDYRGFGASEGMPRGRLDPMAQIEDYRNALSFLSLHPRVDAARLGVWGTSFSGAHVLHLGAFDPRVKAVVSQVPAIDVQANAHRLMGDAGVAAMLNLVVADRHAQFQGAAPQTIPVVAPPGEPCMLPSPESHDMLLEQQRTIAPNWVNSLTLDSFERIFAYRPGRNIGLIAPKPLLMIVALGDTLTPPDLALGAFAEAGEPKRLLTFDGPHYGAYADPATFEVCVNAAIEHFRLM